MNVKSKKTDEQRVLDALVGVVVIGEPPEWVGHLAAMFQCMVDAIESGEPAGRLWTIAQLKILVDAFEPLPRSRPRRKRARARARGVA